MIVDLARTGQAARRRLIRVMQLVILSLGVAGTVGAASPTASPDLSHSLQDRVAVQGSGVRIEQAFQFKTDFASDPPPATDLQSLGLEKTSGGYAAHLAFGEVFHQLPGETVVTSVQAPGGDPRYRIALQPDGSGSLDRVTAGHPTKIDTVTPVVNGKEVILPIPASLNLNPEWEIDAALEVHDAQGNGFHSHSPQVPIGALTGEGSPQELPMSRDGAILEKFLPSDWKRQAMPVGTRPTHLRLERQSGHLVAVVGMDAPPQPASIQGRPATRQAVSLRIVRDLAHVNDPTHRIDFDVSAGKGTAYDISGAMPIPVATIPVTISGSDLVFQLPAPGPSRTLGMAAAPVAALVAMADTSAPVDGTAVAQPAPNSCPSATTVTFPVRISITNNVLHIVHSDGDDAAGPINPDGTAHLTSPGGRTYDLQKYEVSMLQLIHQFQGCSYFVQIKTNSPLPALATSASSSPSPPPRGTLSPGFVLPIDGNSFIGVTSVVSDQNGNGVISASALVRTGVLDPPGTITQATTPQFPWPILLIAIGGGIAIAILIIVLRQRGGHEDGVYPEFVVYPEFAVGQGAAAVDPTFAYGDTPIVEEPWTQGQDGGDDGTSTETTGGDRTTTDETTTTDDCDELLQRCEEAKKAAEAAEQKAAEARAKADKAKKDCDDAKKAVATARAALDALQAPNPADRSWVQDVATGRKVTGSDLQLENEAAQAAWQQYKAGDISAQQLEDIWNHQMSPEGLDELRAAAKAARQKKIDDAQAKLDDAKAKQDQACQAADQAAAEASSAKDEAAKARAAADAACKAAADCLKQSAPQGSGGSTTDGGPSGGGGSTGGGGSGSDHGGGDPPPGGGTGGGTTTDGGGGGGTPPGGGGTQPPALKQHDSPCPDGKTELRNAQSSGMLDVPAPGDSVKVTVTDLKGVSQEHSYEPSVYYETTPKEFRRKSDSSAVGATNLYTVDITVSMEHVQYSCSEKWVCEGGTWVDRGRVKKLLLQQPFTLNVLHKENLKLSEIQGTIKSSWPAIKKIMDAAASADNFCLGGEEE